MFENGLGETCEFGNFHPAVIACYYIVVLGITMFSVSPVFLCITFLFAWLYALLLSGKKMIKKNLLIMGSVVILMTAINTFFTHNGETVLFYLNKNRITLEALVYGFCISIMLVSVVIWFESFQVLMSSDKLVFLFGRLIPVIGLVVSMIFRFIPLLKSRYEEIAMGQKCMGRSGQKGMVSRVRQLTKEVSILIAWSLEASIESADSMAARGYGLPGRSSFHLFRMTRRDILAFLYLGVTGAAVIAGGILGETTMTFYPKLVWEVPNPWVTAAFILLLILPLVIDVAGEYKWRRSVSDM